MRTFRLLAAVALAAAGLIFLLFMPRLAARAATGAVCTWSAPADGIPRNWSDAANWSCGAAPGAGDTAIVNVGGNVINVDVPITAQNLTLTGGELRGYQTLTVTGQMTWTYGTIFGGAALSPTGALETLVIAPGARLNLDSSYVRLKHSTLVNYGTVQQGNASVVLAENAVFDNRAGGVFAVADGRILDDDWPPGSRAGLFINAGTLLKQNGGEYSMRARLTNAGHVQVVSGTLRLYHGEPPDLLVTHTGSFAVAPAGTLTFDGLKSDFASSSSFDISGTVSFVGGAAGTVRGAYDGPGLTFVNAATLHFERADGAATLTHLNLGGSSRLRGTNDITVTGAMTMGYGALLVGSTGVSDTVNIAPGATLWVQDGGGLSGRTLNNHGDITLASGGRFVMQHGAVFNNHPTGVFTVTKGDMRQFDFEPGGGVLNNAGRIIKTEGGEFKLNAALSNSGQVSVTNGTLVVNSAFNVVVTHSGAFAVAAPGILQLQDWEHYFAPSSTIAGDGIFRLSGAHAVVGGAYTLTGLTDLISGGNLEFATPGGAVTLPQVNMGNNARLRGTNDITVTGVLTMSGGGAVVEGSSSNTNTLNITPGATLRIEQSGGLSFRTLNNHGSFEQATGQQFFMINDAIFNNGPTGVYTVSSGGMGWGIAWSAIGKQFNNQGRMVKQGAGEFKVWFSIAVSNSGTLDVDDGTLLVDGDFVQSAGETRLRNGSVLGRSVGWSGDLVFNGGALRGLGTLDFGTNSGIVQNNGAVVDPIGRLTINDGGYRQAANGTLQIDVGGLTPDTQHDVLSVSGSATLDGRLILAATDGFAPAAGDVFNVITYGSRNGEFAAVDRGLGLAFGPEYQSGGVVISDNPTLIEFSQKPDAHTIRPGQTDGFTLRMTNPGPTPLNVALSHDLPSGFSFIPGSSTSSIALAQPNVTMIAAGQTLVWPEFAIAPSASITVHFGAAVTTTIGSYTYTAALVVTPTIGDARLLRLIDQVDVWQSPVINTVITGIHANAYPPAEPDGLWTITFSGRPSNEVGLIITSTPVCARPPCGPLKRFFVLNGSEEFAMTLVEGTVNRYSVALLPGAFQLFEPLALVPVYARPETLSSSALPDRMGGGDSCTKKFGAGGESEGYTVYVEGDGYVPCKPPTSEPKKIDPSGYVTDARTGAPIQGATVTLYRVPSALPDTRTTARECRTVNTRPGGTWDLLPPATANLGLFEEPGYSPTTMDPSINPQRTDEVGHYGWDVIRGCWYVKVEAVGYFTRYSAVVGVPPEVTDLHLALTPWNKVFLPLTQR